MAAKNVDINIRTKADVAGAKQAEYKWYCNR